MSFDAFLDAFFVGRKIHLVVNVGEMIVSRQIGCMKKIWGGAATPPIIDVVSRCCSRLGPFCALFSA